MHRRRFARGVAFATLAFPWIARANGPAPFSRPTGSVPGVVVERASPLRVEREDLVVDCATTAPLHPQCTFVATYALRNPSPAEEELLGAFYTTEAERPATGRSEYHGPESVAAELDGVDARVQATSEQLERMDAIVLEDPELGAAQKPPALRRQPFRILVIPSLSVGAGAAVQLRTQERRRFGGRTQVTISWPFLSVVIPVDFYPVAGSAGSHVSRVRSSRSSRSDSASG